MHDDFSTYRPSEDTDLLPFLDKLIVGRLKAQLLWTLIGLGLITGIFVLSIFSNGPTEKNLTLLFLLLLGLSIVFVAARGARREFQHLMERKRSVVAQIRVDEIMDVLTDDFDPYAFRMGILVGKEHGEAPSEGAFYAAVARFERTHRKGSLPQKASDTVEAIP